MTRVGRLGVGRELSSEWTESGLFVEFSSPADAALSSLSSSFCCRLTLVAPVEHDGTKKVRKSYRYHFRFFVAAWPDVVVVISLCFLRKWSRTVAHLFLQSAAVTEIIKLKSNEWKIYLVTMIYALQNSLQLSIHTTSRLYFCICA